MDIQGHRGCRGLYPENSLPAFEKAIELDVHTLELDVVISKDHKVVVSHEPYMNHEIALDTFGNSISQEEEISYNLYKMTYDSIQMYDCGSKVHPRFPEQKKLKVYKPLLDAIITLGDSLTNKTIRYNIEIKSLPEYDGVYSPKIEQFVQLVIDVIESKNITERTTLQSFDIRALEIIQQKLPNVTVALLVDDNESIDKKLQQLSFQPDILSPYYKLLSAENVREFQDANLKVIPWTLNDTKDIQQMIDFKVDGIITDYPDRLISLLNTNK
uniref:glycerophosphodiester phosphodiesterase n=1 Tax=Gelidibacter sp. TaxID=2018083 RepID=UPI00404961C9